MKRPSNHRLTPFPREAGFTLIELMISITLGLLIVAAAAQLFIGGGISMRLQQSAADTQDNGLFGLDYIAKDIRLANYGNIQNLVMTDTTKDGGIVLTADSAAITTSNLTGVRTSNLDSDYVSAALVTLGNGDTVGTGNAWTGVTKITSPAGVKSDQLTIQFLAPMAMNDCEGNAITQGTRVIERYFLRADTTDATALVLACDAGTISAKVDAVDAVAAAPGQAAIPAIAYVPPIVSNFGDAGQVLINRVEHLHILLGTQKADGTLMYYNIHDYKALAVKPQIKSIQFAVLVRSTDNTASAIVDPTQSFKMLDQTVNVAATNTTANRYVRRVYSTTMALRNGFGSVS
ncbi:PilW family protein [Aquirhabdus parva]|uniref:Prepilin-type N-terminal cleavage/methylation domain-containing protein n=1 Tax=Aquirhabdus parva TaxID=2283318 RepID=A0A345P2L0_9GAMM|nr:PilW family protein [Aquirhabdus parva]AXI01519.1 prepilin-type N-terminal cleavage/methylation domain-containing protein [Aquirhabdus parva]